MNADIARVRRDCTPAMGPVADRIINLGIDINFNDLVKAQDVNVREAARKRISEEIERIGKALPRNSTR